MKKINLHLLYSIFFLVMLAPLSLSSSFSFGEWFNNFSFSKKKKEQVTKEFPAHKAPTITIETLNGDISIKTWKQEKILFEAMKEAKEEDLKDIEINVKTSSKTLQVQTKENKKTNGTVSYQLIVPEDTILKYLKTNRGNIKIKDVYGDKIVATTEQGSIDIVNAKNTVLTKVRNKGSISIIMQELPAQAKCIAETKNGNIFLTLPENAQANLSAETQSGIISSEQEVTLDPYPMKLNPKAFIRLKRNINAKLGEGGAAIKLQTDYGSIRLFEQYRARHEKMKKWWS